MKRKPPPFRYLLRFVSEPSGEQQHETVHRDDVVARIIDLRHQGVRSIEAFIDVELEIGFTVKLEGIDT